MNRLLFACIGVAATGVLLALLGPAIGLGSAYSFILYRWFGLSRHELLLASGLALAALIAVWVIRAFFLPTLHRLYLAILSIAFLLPPLHSLYLAVLSIVFIPYYLSHSFERPTWAIISLVAMPIGAAIGGWIARAKRRVELAQTWAVAVWSALFAFFASDMFLKARASIQETHVQRILRERLRDPTALPAIFPRVLVGDSDPPGSFALKDSAGLDFVPLADVSRSLAVYCKEIGDYTIYRSDGLPQSRGHLVGAGRHRRHRGLVRSRRLRSVGIRLCLADQADLPAKPESRTWWKRAVIRARDSE